MVAFFTVVGCSTLVQVRALPAREIRVPSLSTAAVFVLPQRGMSASATLGDGTPVWISRDANDDVAVVAPIEYIEGRNIGTVAMWIPRAQRFFDTAWVWDARGRLLAVEGGAVCGADAFDVATGEYVDVCTPTSLPAQGRDLDTFAFDRIDPEHIRVGARVAGVMREVNERIAPPREFTESTPWEAPDVPLRSVASAVVDREGELIFIDADVVFSEGDAPRICNRGDGFGSARQPCPNGSPRVYDIDGSTLNDNVYARSGPIFARRYRDGFVQVALQAGRW